MNGDESNQALERISSPHEQLALQESFPDSLEKLSANSRSSRYYLELEVSAIRRQ